MLLKKGHRFKKQAGVAAIEFALIFVILFATFYALVSYTFPLLLLQTFNHAAAQAARMTIQADMGVSTGNYITRVREIANDELDDQLEWLPNTISSKLSRNINYVNGRVVVEIVYPNYNAQPVVPKITLPLIGDIPKLPNEIRATASISS